MSNAINATDKSRLRLQLVKRFEHILSLIQVLFTPFSIQGVIGLDQKNVKPSTSLPQRIKTQEVVEYLPKPVSKLDLSPFLLPS
ncbi:hypothetical protein [Nostoc sp. UHCC 0302]|uniref:hypothetical protein n=1 Tax=Nostoc sp. UHCC 0302 TaxID=3134896 RepID=UPI00311C9137